jgi:flavin-dependent dehydrogenase
MHSDVLLIGGGPAGSTAAALLARAGHSVTVIEKARHPRFHIGESLLPANLPLLERLGVADEVRAIGMPKLGAEFISHWDGRAQEFRFAEAWNSSLSGAYQVRRSEFDHILLRNAARCGARVLEGARVTDVAFPQDTGPVRATVRNEDGHIGHYAGRFLIDASGRDTFLANRLGLKRRNRHHNSAALFGHFEGARRNEGERAGHICVYWFDHGWFWFIPLSDGATSVGAVVWPYYLKSRSCPLNEFLLETIGLCPPLAERLRDARLIRDAEATGNYSYDSARTHGDNFLLLGDAFAFIDPVFSSGVMLAMQSAFDGATAVDCCLRHPAQARRALRTFDRAIRHGPREFAWFIYRVTSPTMREMFMAPRNWLRMKQALLSMLAGDIFGDTPIWPSLQAFKMTYRLLSLAHPRRNALARRRRRQNIQPLDPGPLPAS